MKETKPQHILNIVSRWAVGLTFIFSGFVKGVDPLGTVYKIQEYMTAWSIGSFTFEWALPLAGFMSVALVTLEFTIGIMLITNSYRRLTAWLLSAFMVFFTVTTLIDALTNAVTDCGCFGEAVKLTNWQTFWKNVGLDVFTLIIFIQRKKRWTYRRHFERETLLAIVSMACMIIFSIWNINNEPCIDFRAWKVGTQMIPSDPNLQPTYSFVYQDKETGDTMTLDYAQLSAHSSDAAWLARWECVSTTMHDPYEIDADGFSMMNPVDEQDYTRELLSDTNFLLIATIHHIDEVTDDGQQALQGAKLFCESNGIRMVLLCAYGEEEPTFLFLADHQMSDLDTYVADNKAIETMLRSNPGFLLMKSGRVMGKWHHRNIGKLFNYPFEK